MPLGEGPIKLNNWWLLFSSLLCPALLCAVTILWLSISNSSISLLDLITNLKRERKPLGSQSHLWSREEPIKKVQSGTRKLMLPSFFWYPISWSIRQECLNHCVCVCVCVCVRCTHTEHASCPDWVRSGSPNRGLFSFIPSFPAAA